MDIPAVERAIVSKLVTDAVTSGHLVSVHDGNEWVLSRSADVFAVLRVLFSVNEETLRFWKDGKKVGDVLLIHGNGTDVLSDWSDNEATNSLIENSINLAEDLNYGE